MVGNTDSRFLRSVLGDLLRDARGRFRADLIISYKYFGLMSLIANPCALKA